MYQCPIAIRGRKRLVVFQTFVIVLKSLLQILILTISNSLKKFKFKFKFCIIFKFLISKIELIYTLAFIASFPFIFSFSAIFFLLRIWVCLSTPNIEWFLFFSILSSHSLTSFLTLVTSEGSMILDSFLFLFNKFDTCSSHQQIRVYFRFRALALQSNRLLLSK